MDEKEAPPPYPGNGSSPGEGFGTNYQTEYSNEGYQTGGQPTYQTGGLPNYQTGGLPPYQNNGQYMQAPPNQPFINQQQQQQQQMMNNTVVVGGMGGMGVPMYQTVPQDYSTQACLVVGGMGGMGVPMYQTVPQDYSTQAWLACLCCFWPTGLLAIMKASESRDALARGDLIGAHTAANSARQMVRISYIVGLISIIFAGVIFGVYFGLIVSDYNDNNNY